MFHIRDRASNTDQGDQTSSMVEISASWENLPISPSTQTQEPKSLNRWCTLGVGFKRFYEQIHNFEVLPDDVFVVTFPKSGTTWMQEAAWLLLNDLDYEQARGQHLHQRSVFMDRSAIFDDVDHNTVLMAQQMRSPRLIKTHLPGHLIPRQIWQRKTKVVYCARNPKDVVSSYFHFLKGLGTWSGSLEEYIEDFINDELMYTPFWPHVLDFWRMRHEPNVFFTTYEEMQRDLAKVLRELCSFLERPALSEEQMATLVDHLSFENMKNNDQTNPTTKIQSGHGGSGVLPDFQFMRRGIVGSYKADLTPEVQQRLDSCTGACLNAYHVTLEEIFGEI